MEAKIDRKALVKTLLINNFAALNVQAEMRSIIRDIRAIQAA